MNWSKRRVRRGPMLDDILSAPTPIETPIKACVSCGRTKDDAATLAAKAVDEINVEEEDCNTTSSAPTAFETSATRSR